MLRTIKAGRRNARGQLCVVDAPNALVSGYLRELNSMSAVGLHCIIVHLSMMQLWDMCITVRLRDASHFAINNDK